VPSELVSGPDLGAGYLHQLSIDRSDDRVTFTYHAQDGGADANGPPIGPLDVLGYVHPESACQFGGPRCWHRRFLLPFAEVPRVRQTYNRSRFVLEATLRQRFGGGRVPADATLAEIVARLREPLQREGISWYVGGSMAARLLGAPIEPGDLDLGTSRPGVDRIGALLAEYLIEPVAPTDWTGAGIVRGARAFVGTLAEGARVEWAVPLDPTPAAGEWGGDPEQVRRLVVEFCGGPLSVARPEYGLVRAGRRGDVPRVAVLGELTRRLGVDRGLLEELLASAAVPAPVAADLRRAAGARPPAVRAARRKTS
jgi:hypothetical protein